LIFGLWIYLDPWFLKFGFEKQGVMSKKPRKNKMDPRQAFGQDAQKPKKEKDWGFDEIARSKTRGR